MEITKLTELRSAYEANVTEGRYSAAEEVCWRALEICGYRGSPRKLGDWLTTGRRRRDMHREEPALWQWAWLLAEAYYELGRYEEAEPVYAWLAAIWMESHSGLQSEVPTAGQVLPDLLRKLAGTQAFLGKERRAGEHWKLAERLSGQRNGVRVPKGDGVHLALRSSDGGRMPATTMISRGATARRLFSRWESIAAHRRFRRNR